MPQDSLTGRPASASAGGVARRVRLPKAAELVAGQLRRKIVEGELQEGDALPQETSLIAQFNVSRPTLREAFRVLESEGLISVRRGAHGGARVHAPSEQVAARYAGLVLQSQTTDLADLSETRDILEPAAVRLAAQRATKDDIARLRQLCEEARADPQDADHQIVLMHRFHRHVVRAAGNPGLVLLCEIIDHLIGQVAQSFLESVRSADDRVALQEAWGVEEAITAHERLVELIEQGDADAAESAWRAHIEHSSELMLSGAAGKRVVDFLDYPGYD